MEPGPQAPDAVHPEFDALPKDIFGGGHPYHADQRVLVHDTFGTARRRWRPSNSSGWKPEGSGSSSSAPNLTAAAGLILGLAGPGRAGQAGHGGGARSR